jgi:hypothetical protein
MTLLILGEPSINAAPSRGESRLVAVPSGQGLNAGASQ